MGNVFSACPVCDANISLAAGTEESEIISCSDCSSRLVVAAISGSAASLVQAPQVEEDWGQ